MLRGFKLDELGSSPQIEALKASGAEVPGILHLLAARPDFSRPLNELAQAVMRGPGALPHWQRELIAALTSRAAGCVF